MRTIRAARVLTPAGWLEDAVVEIDGPLISGVRAAAEGNVDADWANVAVIPGTVNAHGHSFQNLLKGFADDRLFASWRDDVLYPFSQGLTVDAIYTGALFAFGEALRAGITTTVDFFYLHDDGNENAIAVVRAARAAGIRLVLARAFYDLDAPTSAPARYREEAETAAEHCRDLHGLLAGDPLTSVQPAPHSLHAASPRTLGIARDLARELGVPWHLHLAEAEYELEQVTERFGTTPVRLLERAGLLDDALVTVHTVWADDAELEMIAAAGAAVVHCVGANAFLGDGVARIPEMRALGIPVGLGADGGCANNRQSIFDEMRVASLFAKARLRDGSALPSTEVFDLGTRMGASILGIDAGVIAPGYAADLVAVDLDDLSLQPTRILERNLVHSMQPTAISKVMVAGELAVSDGRLTRIDERDLVRDIAAVTQGWVRA